MKNSASGFIAYLLCFLLTLLPPGLQAEPTGFDITDYPAFSPPFVDDAKTQMGIANDRIEYSIGGAGHRSGIENELYKAYRWYRQAGYTIPPISPRTTYLETGEELYRVFAFDFAAHNINPGIFGYYQADANCDSSRPETDSLGRYNWIAINSSALTARPFLRFSALSHELFHAMEYAYPLFYNAPCAPDWIREGLADAAANFVTENLYPTEFSNNKTSLTKASLRSYRVAFQDANDWIGDPYFRQTIVPGIAGYAHTQPGGGGGVSQIINAQKVMGYLTSGFWQFLAQRSTGVRPDRASSAELSRLLGTWVPLMQTLPPGRIDPNKGWLRLVNDFVEAHLGLETGPDVDALYAWLPEFFTEFASWWEVRHMGFSEDREAWLSDAFGGCEKVELKPGTGASGSSKKITLAKIAKNSARCIDVKLSGFTNPVNLKVKAEFKSANPDQFHLGLARVEAPSGSSTVPFNCWTKHNGSKRLKCRRLGMAGENAKIWKSLPITAENLDLGSGPIDATLTYVFSNVSMSVPDSRRVESLDLIFSATYGDGGAKKFAPPNSIRPADPQMLSQMMSNKKEVFYRLFTNQAQAPANLFDIELNLLEGGEQPRCGGDRDDMGSCAYDSGGDYFIRPASQVAFGQTGFIMAAVHKTAGQQPFLVSSTCSQEADSRAVEVLESSVDGLVIRVNSDLCEIPGKDNNYCSQQPFCPVKDHLSITFTLGLGREHFAESASVHQLTPGTRFDMDLYFRDGVPTEGGSGSSDSSSGGAGGGADGGGSGSNTPGSSSGGSSGQHSDLALCACTCEEQQASTQLAGELKARAEAGENISISQIMGTTSCNSTCQREYMICLMDQDVARKKAEQDARDSADAALEACDCSCEQMVATNNRARELEQQLIAGGTIPIEEMKNLTRCAKTCQQQHMTCMSEGIH